jgi:hypothetical protein
MSQANDVPGRSDNPPLQRQAPTTWNVSPTYDRGRLSLRVGISYNGARRAFESGLNLNNEIFGFYNGSPEYVLQREFYGPMVGGGVRWSPTREKF